MSNFLFQNIGAVFGAPSIVTEIVKKLNPAQEEKLKRNKDSLDRAADISVNQDGNVEIPGEIVIGKTQDLFGEKIYEDMVQSIAPAIDRIAEEPLDHVQTKRQTQTVVDTVKETIKQKVLAPVLDNYDVKKSTQNRLEREVSTEIDRAFGRLQGDYEQQINIARIEHKKKRETAATPEQVQAADRGYQDEMNAAMQSFMQSMQTQVEETIQHKPQELVEKLERHKAEEEKRSIEDDVRARLRGFSRTIPSFLMAYGDGHLTLQNFDAYTEGDVFLEVTGITVEDRSLYHRDHKKAIPQQADERVFSER